MEFSWSFEDLMALPRSRSHVTVPTELPPGLASGVNAIRVRDTENRTRKITTRLVDNILAIVRELGTASPSEIYTAMCEDEEFALLNCDKKYVHKLMNEHPLLFEKKTVGKKDYFCVLAEVAQTIASAPQAPASAEAAGARPSSPVQNTTLATSTSCCLTEDKRLSPAIHDPHLNEARSEATDMSTFITFPANNEAFKKRKRVHRACESCRKKRKACTHHAPPEDEDEDPPLPAAPAVKTDEDAQLAAEGTTITNPIRVPASPSLTLTKSAFDHLPEPKGPTQDYRDARPTMLRKQSPTSKLTVQTPPNFAGVLNPQAVLREPVKSPTKKPRKSQWKVKAQPPRELTHPTPQDDSRIYRIVETCLHPRLQPQVSAALQTYLDAVGVDLLPPRMHQPALLEIYFSYVHPLLPLVDKELFFEQYNYGREPRILMQVICIVASKHATAANHLYLGMDRTLLGPRDFSQRLYDAAITAIDMKIEENRVVLIQALGLISLHCEGPDGAEQASMHLAQAIHHAHTFGSQFEHRWKGRSSQSHGSLEDMYWCLWSLDKVNACMNGRPLLMHDRDNSMGLPSDPTKRSSPFGIWLQIAQMLHTITDYYRPGGGVNVTGWEGDGFLGFEEMVGDGGDQLDGPITSLLSLFHHTMCMASHKSVSVNASVQNTPSAVRQSLSATRVIHLLNAEPPELLPPLPIVPYALGVALSVAYRHFRSRRIKVHINRATEELKQCVELLDRLRNSWWSAGTTADLGRAVLSNAAAHNTNGANRSSPSISGQPWLQNMGETPIDPQLQQHQNHPHANSPMNSLLNPISAPTPGQHPTSSERADRAAPMTGPPAGFGFAEQSPDWLNFDAAFENFEGLLGSSGAGMSNELFQPLNYETLEGLMGSPA